jgi:lipoprotein-anchoring transpeptidase ErfK/SrfK
MGLAMGDGYGIHGTQEEKTIGQSKSKGCVRMYQHDLEELFDLTLTGDQVLITEE